MNEIINQMCDFKTIISIIIFSFCWSIIWDYLKRNNKGECKYGNVYTS